MRTQNHQLLLPLYNTVASFICPSVVPGGSMGMDDNHPDVSPVSWQTAFWTLLPLAVNVMTQRSGRVLGLSPQYRTYLRSSPIICTADTVAIIFQFLFSITYGRMSSRNALSAMIQARFSNVEEPAEGLQSLENQTGMRWLWFILGTLID
jgi:hypothetical protein